MRIDPRRWQNDLHDRYLLFERTPSTNRRRSAALTGCAASHSSLSIASSVLNCKHLSQLTCGRARRPRRAVTAKQRNSVWETLRGARRSPPTLGKIFTIQHTSIPNNLNFTAKKAESIQRTFTPSTDGSVTLFPGCRAQISSFCVSTCLLRNET